MTTGVYCRPGCGAKPLAENVRTFELAASAEAAGFRACLRCRPYRAASPIASGAPELVCRAVQLIIDGVLDTGTQTSLGARLAVSPRHLRRIFNDHLGVTPDQLARSRRAHFARRLLDDTDLTAADVAFASGFASIRQFNREMREVFRASPSQLRHRRRRTDQQPTQPKLSKQGKRYRHGTRSRARPGPALPLRSRWAGPAGASLVRGRQASTGRHRNSMARLRGTTGPGLRKSTAAPRRVRLRSLRRPRTRRGSCAWDPRHAASAIPIVLAWRGCP